MVVMPQATAANKRSQAKNRMWLLILAACAVLLVLITGTYTYYAAGQLHKMKRSTEAAEGANRIAEQALEITNRAYLSITVKTVDSPEFLTELSPTIWFSMSNVGHTPAFKILGEKKTRLLAHIGEFAISRPH